MNKVILLGRLTKDPETRYSQGSEPVAISKYTLAVNRRFKKQNEPDVDFINCVTFGKSAEFAEKYFKKGQQVSIVGRLQVSTYEKDGVKKWSTDVAVEEQFFAESKGAAEVKAEPPKKKEAKVEADFFAIDEDEDEDLPF